MRLGSLPTPQVVVDLPRLRRNISRMAALASRHGKRLRPHAKTHKNPQIARWQIEAGAVGVCCAKLGEAEVFAANGLEDIRLPYPVNPSNADRVLALLDRCRLSIVLDHARVAEQWSSRMVAAGRDLDVLVKVDVGLHRCGIAPDLPGASEFVARVAAMPGLRFRGVLSHAGHAYLAADEAAVDGIARAERDLLLAIVGDARRRGVEVEEVSVGATPTARFSAALDGITELRPGNYVFLDRTQVGLSSATLDDCALTVAAMVVSKPSADRLILDCGSKTLSSDGARGFGPATGHGLVFAEWPSHAPLANLVIDRLSEEHAAVTVTDGTTPLEPGDRVRVLPNHACVVTNLVDEVVLADGDEVLGRLPVAARGCIR